MRNNAYAVIVSEGLIMKLKQEKINIESQM